MPVLGEPLRGQVPHRADEPHRRPVVGALDARAAAEQPVARQLEVDVVVAAAHPVAQALAQQRHLLALDRAVRSVGVDAGAAVEVLQRRAAAQRRRRQLVGPRADPGHPLELGDASRVGPRAQLDEHHDLEVGAHVPADDPHPDERPVGADQPGVAVGPDDQPAQVQPQRPAVGVAR
ncbi:hypothetical protein ACFQV8_08580 [Pseudonocardia benzenivorans]